VQLLAAELIERILGEAFELLMTPGVRVGSAPVIELLRAAGVDVRDGVARLPEALVRRCLESVPRDFYLYNRQGDRAVHYGGDDVHFDPGSCCVLICRITTFEQAGGDGIVFCRGPAGDDRSAGGGLRRSGAVAAEAAGNF
jgi:trimethylamine:corrinoid methyltransferase-like protein